MAEIPFSLSPGIASDAIDGHRNNEGIGGRFSIPAWPVYPAPALRPAGAYGWHLIGVFTEEWGAAWIVLIHDPSNTFLTYLLVQRQPTRRRTLLLAERAF